MNTVVVVAALAGLVIALRTFKAPKAQKVRVPVTLPTRKRKSQK
jgi:hypothetical protein